MDRHDKKKRYRNFNTSLDFCTTNERFVFRCRKLCLYPWQTPAVLWISWAPKAHQIFSRETKHLTSSSRKAQTFKNLHHLGFHSINGSAHLILPFSCILVDGHSGTCFQTGLLKSNPPANYRTSHD